MSNKLNEVSGGITGVELTGKTVVIRAASLKPEYTDKDRRFVVSGGFGASPYTVGRAVFGKFLLDNEDARMDRGDVEGIAAVQEETVQK
jgi:hypothetical protein